MTRTKPNGASRLQKVLKGALQTGCRYTFYGIEAVGKSTLAAHSNAPIFIDCEDGSSRLDVARYLFRDEPGGHVPRTYEEVLHAIADLAAHEHPYRTLVIDTIDRLEGLMFDYVLRRDSGKVSQLNKGGKKLDSMESYGWGKGFQVANDELRGFLNELEKLRAATGMDIALLGHAAVRIFRNPDGDDWDRYQLRLQHNDKVSNASLVKEWSDVVGFCRFEEGASKLDPDQRKAKGYSTGRRVVNFERTAAFDAKTRIPLPESIVLESDNPWLPIADAVRIGESLDPEALIELIDAEVERIGDDKLATEVRTAADKQKGNVATLSRYLNNLKRREPVAAQESSNV